jgi:iron complex outermembrane receptor protein
MKFKQKKILICVISALATSNLITTNVYADDLINLNNVTVTATRVEENIASIPESITVITGKDIQKQVSLSNGDLSSALGKLIPGYSVGNQSMSNYGQNLRGRKASVLVDGVPQNPIFDPGKNLTVIDPGMIERIEVIRGATAIYGDAATGGIINIITKKPTDGAPVNITTIGADMSLTHPGDSFGGNLKHTLSGKSNQFSYLVGAAIQKTGGWFDADGDRIAPNPHRDGGLSDTDQYNLFTKLGFDIDEKQKISANLNLFRNLQKTDYIGDMSQRYVFNGEKARAVSGLFMTDPVGVKNIAGGFDYNNLSILGSKLHAQVFYKDYWARSNPFDDFGTAVYQDTIKSTKSGGRLEFDTPLIDNKLSVLWGADYTHERIQQTVKEMDMALYLSSNKLIYQANGVEKFWLSPYSQDNYALFAQAELKPIDSLVLRAGIRQEREDLDIPSFVTLSNRSIKGGKLDYSTTLFNAGAVYYWNDSINTFANFSQGFSLPDVRQRLRSAPVNGDVANLNIEPEKVDNYEVGVRGDWNKVNSTVSVFYNKSKLGANPPANFTLPVVRAPEKIYGIEATLDWQVTDALKTGGTATYSEGKQDLATDTVGYIYLNNQRIRPPKLTAYVEHQTLPNWSNRLQVLASGSRNRFDNSTASFMRKVSGFATLDYISEVKFNKDSLLIGVENILNKQYFTPQSQQFLEGDVTHAAAKGATLSVTYILNW